MSHTLYSFGYSSGTLADLKAVLASPSAVLVDCRFVASSRIPGWNGVELRRRWGRKYLHARALGNSNFRGGPVQLADEARGIEIVLKLLSQDRTVVLLCGCSDWRRCHRSFVADKILSALGGELEIVHL